MNRTPLITFVAFLINSRALPAADFATQMVEATFKFENGGNATCFLVRREAPDTRVYLVTAGHALKDTTNQTAKLILRKPKADGSYERVEYPLPLRRDDKPLWVCHEKEDVAVLRLAEPLPVTVTPLPVSMIADEARLKSSGVHVCSPLFVLGYPWGLEADASGLPIARQGIFSSPPLLPLRTHPTFQVDYKAFKGDSGGPVFISGADNHPLVVGVVSDQHYYSEDSKSTYETRSVTIPLDVVKAIHAQYVRDTLEAAAKQRESASK